jgi:hypothetical protein
MELELSILSPFFLEFDYALYPGNYIHTPLFGKGA